jgi:hypothetical protein
VPGCEARGVNVVAMSRFDMIAWVKRGTREEVGVITDYTNGKLTQFNKDLVISKPMKISQVVIPGNQRYNRP